MLQDGIILYHGSYAEIDDIDLSKCDTTKDFGRGFYLTTSKTQAESFIKTSILKAKRNGLIPENRKYGYVTEYKVNLNSGVSYYEFEGTTKDWLYYIAINRRRPLSDRLLSLLTEDFDKYEILIGKIANDDTNITLNAFLGGTFGDVDSNQTYEIVKNLLKPERLENQFCFKSQRSTEMLEKMGAEKYEIR